VTLPLDDDFKTIVLNNTPLLDVRAPVEFAKGAFYNATNLPIMNDEERHLVGTEYKQAGNAAAVALAEKLIKNEGKEQRVAAWKRYIAQNPEAKLYCFRGGQRSKISQEWLHEAGINITRLKGGYKAFRNFLMERSLAISAQTPTLILGGRTGSGKTILLHQLQNSIDLEALANHRGSSFGNYANEQPSQIDFENNLAYKLIQFEEKNYKKLIIEHESQNIGRMFIPKPVYENFMDGKLVILETPLQKRVDITYHEYVTLALQKYEEIYKENALKEWHDYVIKSLEKIKKRLGSELHRELFMLFEDAYKQHGSTYATTQYKEWIAKLLTHYYDPMYDYQIRKTSIDIAFRGDEKSVLEYLKYS